MDRHARIDSFSLAAHRLAVERLREQPARVDEALGVIARWRVRAAGPSHCDPYWDEWQRLLEQGVDSVERVALSVDAHGATLRSVSPLGRFISVSERNGLLKQALEAA
jgi:hypothetical protein